MTNKDDIKFIQALSQLLNDSELAEIEVVREYGEYDALEVRLSKYPSSAGTVVASAPVAAPAFAPPAPASSASAESVQSPASPVDDTANAEFAPMVGTVYLSAEPGAAPYIKIGDKVTEGQTLLIIEAMKTMNQIPATKSGTVKRIVVNDASPVEYGDPLVVIE